MNSPIEKKDKQEVEQQLSKIQKVTKKYYLYIFLFILRR